MALGHIYFLGFKKLNTLMQLAAPFGFHFF